MNVLEQTQVRPEVDHFVTVPETTLSSGIIVLSFQVGKYACTRGIDGKAAVSATDEPWVSITYYDAVDACKKCRLQTHYRKAMARPRMEC